jgi:hypothetical protein
MIFATRISASIERWENGLCLHKEIVVSNRLGHVLLVAHLVLVIGVFAGKPAVNREFANKPRTERNASSSILLAGRSFHYSNESTSSKH